MKILLTENIHQTAKERLQTYGHQVELIAHAPDEDELNKILPNYDVLGIRSKTHLTQAVLEKNSHLIGIGCFCIGTNQVDLSTAKNRGIAVFNAPHSNTRSVAELVLAEMVALSRHLGDINTLAHQGTWRKSAKGSHEIRGKTLGIVGYGHIGSQVSILAEAFGLHVIFYDVAKKLPLGNATCVETLDDLLSSADFVSLHVPETPDTKNMIQKSQLEKMKQGSYLINASRGTVVDIQALRGAIDSGHLAGCAIDVFPSEPASNKEEFDSILRGASNVILTPHIGGSTEEAQLSIGNEVSESLHKFISQGISAGSVNIPNIDAPVKAGTRRIVNIHQNVPGVLGQINGYISETGVNIEGQNLATDEHIGFLLIDVQEDQAKSLLKRIKSMDKCILTRLAE